MRTKPISPALVFFNGTENLPVIRPEVFENANYSHFTEILQKYFEIKKVSSPFVFKFQGKWFLALDSKNARVFTKKEVLSVLNNLVSQPKF